MKGLVQFTFPSGVEAIIEGPSQLEITSDEAVKMDDGLAWFRVPQTGHGFTVQTDRVDVVDLGTEFGVWFDADGNIQVHVAEGKVRVEPALEKIGKSDLVGGEAMLFDESGRGESVALTTSLFRREFSKSVPYLHWSFDELVNGAFPAKGNIPGVEEFEAKLKHLRLNNEKIDVEDFRVKGRYGAAFSMKGKGLYAESLYPGIGGNTPRSIVMWVKHRSMHTSGGINIPYCSWGLRGRANMGKGWKIFVRRHQGKRHFRTSCEQEAGYTNLPVSSSEWVHLASVYTGKTNEMGYPDVRHYINGVPHSVSRSEAPVVVDTDIFSRKAGTVRFGAAVNSHKGAPTIDGDLDELYIFRGALNEKQINQLMKNEKLHFPVEPKS